MSVIRRLSHEVASRIAAGEVIDRPASVLKELIENSLDAGATRIDIESAGAGKSLLRVLDDGFGMEPEDCRAAFERHATSKIREFEDLDALSTFGFRGEALFAICAVSKVALTSTPKGSRNGWRVEASGGRVVKDREAPPTTGTAIEVRELFYNTPARAKFLKSDASEKSHLVQAIEEAALANPRVSFFYKSEGRTGLNLPARNEKDDIAARRERIRDVLGREIGDALLTVRVSRQELSLLGFISPANALIASRNFQLCFVNRRPVSNKTVQQALYRAYEPFREKNRHPAAVLFLEAPANQIDVNVHPTKREVRFRSERSIYETVAQAASKSLLEAKGIPTLDSLRKPAGAPSAESAFGRAAAQSAPVMPAPSSPGIFSKERSRAEIRTSSVHESEGSFTLSERGFQARAPLKSQPQKPWFDPSLRYLGQIERAYLVFDSQGGLLLVDQHAAQERVLFERYVRELTTGCPKTQRLMLPISIELPASALAALAAKAEKMRKAGFEIAPFGKTILHVTEIPAVFAEAKDVRELVHRVLDDFLSPLAAKADVRYHAAATIACKGAVKAHDPLGEREAVALIEALRACEDGTCCPHGRPAMLSFTRDELARRFKRPGPPPL